MNTRFGLIVGQIKRTAIKDFVKSVHKCGLICDQNRFSDYSLQVSKGNAFRKYFHLFWRLFHTFHYILILNNFINGNIDSPKHYLDIWSKYMGGLKQFIYPISLFLSVISIQIIRIFNFSDNNAYYWLKVLEKLRRYEFLGSLGIWNTNLRPVLIKTKYLALLIPYITGLSLFMMFLVSSVLMIKTYSFADLIIYGIPSVILYLIYGYSIVNITFHSVLCLFIICEYSRIKLKNVNKMTENLINKTFVNIKNVNQLIEEHNNICTQITKFNKFWKNFIQGILCLIFPMQLLVLHQLLFGKFETILFRLLFLLLFLLGFGLTSYFIFFFSLITKETNKSYKLLHRFKFKNHLRLNQSIKVSFQIDK